jgi:aspartate aminotransferase-like enzyme
VDDLFRCKQRLCALVNGEHVEILLGSGTLANDVIAGQLKQPGARGLVLTNGEFGDRLVDHAHRMGLEFDTVDAPWGARLPYDRVTDRAARMRYDWMWAAHCETSTGVLNDTEALKSVCERHDIELALDCISSIGAVPVDMSGVHLASGVSGKAVGSYAGLAMVFHRGSAVDGRALPRYLDLAAYIGAPGAPYTTSSNLVAALTVAVDQMLDDRSVSPQDGSTRQNRRREAARAVRGRLSALGYLLVADESIASPAVASFLPPQGIASVSLGEHLEMAGVLVSYRSDYLLERNMLQVCLMGEHDADDLEALLTALAAYRG